MGFLDMGPLEILLILVIALIIWGPGKIPEVARTLGRTVSSLRKATADLTTVVTKELDVEDHPPQPKTTPDSTTQPSSDADTIESTKTDTVQPREQ